MALSLTSTNTSGAVNVNGVDVLTADAGGNVSLRTGGTVQTLPTIAGSQAVGVGQTYRIITGTRAFATTYTNPEDRPRIVLIIYTSTSGTALLNASINGQTAFPIGVSAPTAGASSFGIVLVPAKATYAITVAVGTPTLNTWTELGL